MAKIKTLKTPDSTADVRLVRAHPSNPIVVTQADVHDEGYPRIQVRAPRVLQLRGESSLRFELGARLTMPVGLTAQVVATQPHAHENGYSVDSSIFVDGADVVLFFRNHTRKAVVFNEGAPIADIVFQRRSPLEIEVDCDLPPAVEREPVSRARRGEGGPVEGEEEEAN